MTASIPRENHFRVDAHSPTFLERWIAGTYLVTGIFPIDGRGLTVERMIERIPTFYIDTRSHKRAAWPRGISGYFLIPVYTAKVFDRNVAEWVHSDHPYRWAIWHEPVLYCSADNSAHVRADYGWRGSMFRPYLASVIGAALHAMARQFNHEFPGTINGRQVEETAP